MSEKQRFPAPKKAPIPPDSEDEKLESMYSMIKNKLQHNYTIILDNGFICIYDKTYMIYSIRFVQDKIGF